MADWLFPVSARLDWKLLAYLGPQGMALGLRTRAELLACLLALGHRFVWDIDQSL